MTNTINTGTILIKESTILPEGLQLESETVSAHPRHIQESIFLFRAQRVAQWDRAKLAAA